MRIGVDLGGTNIKVGGVDKEGNIIAKNSRPTKVERGPDPIVRDIIGQIEEILDKINTPLGELKSIGIGVPGLIEKETGNIIFANNLFWQNVKLGEIIKSYFNKPTYIVNDGDAAALGEKIAGSTKGIKNSVLITLGTGVGGGFIINDNIYSGGHGWGSEIGHMIVGENFYNCNCGQNGCWETFVSATGLIKYVKMRISQGYSSLILKIAGGNLEEIDGKTIFNGAKKGDNLALETMDRFIKYLSIGIVNIYNILDPDCIAIGGGLSKAGDLILDPLKKEVSKRVFYKGVNYGDIVLAELGNDGGIIGAGFLHENQPIIP